MVGKDLCEDIVIKKRFSLKIVRIRYKHDFHFFYLEIADTLCYLLVGTSEEEMHGVEVTLYFQIPL